MSGKKPRFDPLPASRSRLGLLVWLLLVTVAALIAWAHFSIIDETARAGGTVIASSREQVIQAVDGGALVELRVREGDRVKEGAVLAVFDDTRTRASLVEIEAKSAALRANLARLSAELQGGAPAFPPEVRRFPTVVRAQTELLNERRHALAAELAALSDVARFAKQELDITERLLASGDVSQIEILRARRSATEAQAQLANRKNKYIQDVSAESARAREDFEQVEQQAAQRRKVLENVVVRAPMAGIVKNVKFTTLGAVLRPGDELLQIVPVGDKMVVEAKVLSKDIALVRPGLPATIRFDSYDYTIFGVVDGEVIYVSADTMRDETRQPDGSPSIYYRVHVRTTAAGPVTRTGREISVIPGMTGTVDIRTGRRSLLAYLLKPVTKTLSEAFRER
jgi:adhesin transport system membrane fusion protein